MRRLAWLFPLFILLLPGLVRAKVLAEVRGLLSHGQIEPARQRIESELSQSGANSELLEAMSWVARSELARKDYEAAQSYAERVYELAAPLAPAARLDADPHLPVAVGAALEVAAQALAASGESGKAVELLRRELGKYGQTSIALRLQKNINLLTLEGKPAPELGVQTYLGPKPQPLSALRGKAVLLFFWADWCGDCKIEGPIIAQLRTEFAAKGLFVVAPTQVYGPDAGQNRAPTAAELSQIDQVRRQSYAALADVPAPVNASNFRNYGASTVPTLVLIDPKGNVVLYHPGRMPYQELKPRIAAILPDS
jgi:thiol-disulfide isomerase/thioredoxin